MSTVFRSRRAVEPRSGGKIVRARRTAGAKTPYDRPPAARHNIPPPESPSWLSRLIFSPTRMIASGSGKLISFALSADISSGSSSSSSSSSSGDSDSEDDTDDNCNDKEISTQGAINCFSKDIQPTTGKSETKCRIEQLVMQETFTREECNKLIKMIESRVVDNYTTEDVENQRLTEMRNRTDGDNAILCSTVAMEARTWLTNKKLESASKSDIDNVTENEGASPVDMAKLYMKARPLWASPSFKPGELKSPSPISTQLFIEETPGSFVGNVVSSSKPKKDTSSIGSWNIEEEIQKVRSKATEEMLRNLPSKRIDWSGFGLENRSSPNAFMPGDGGAGVGNKMHNSSEFINASLNMATERSTSHGFQVLEMTQDGLQIDASSPNQIVTDHEQNQDLEAIQTKTIDGKGQVDCLVDTPNTEQGVKLCQDTKNSFLSDSAAGGVHGNKETNADDQHRSRAVEVHIEGPRSHEENYSTSKEDAAMSCHKANDFPPSSLSTERFTEQNVNLADEGQNAASSNQNKVVTGVFVDNLICTVLSETSVEVLNANDSMNENDSMVDGSQNSLGVCIESPSPRETRANLKRRLEASIGDDAEIQQRGKRLTKYNRRGRGRG